MNEHVQWHGRVARYPKGITTGPDQFHEGPECFGIDQSGYYVWEDQFDHGPKGFGRWCLDGPFKTKAMADKAANDHCAPRDN